MQEKSQNLGGNSSKATTGIAAPGSELQKAAGVTDSGADLVAAEPIAKEMVTQGAKAPRGPLYGLILLKSHVEKAETASL